MNKILKPIIDNIESKKIFSIKGPAGSGKTTQIKNLPQLLYSIGYIPLILAPTNKAVRVLKNKGLEARTMHSALFSCEDTGRTKTEYKIVVDPTTNKPLKDPKNPDLLLYNEEIEPIVEYIFNEEALIKKKILSEDTDLSSVVLIIDEASMINSNIWNNIVNNFSGKVIVVGDVNQLPPIEDQIYQDEDFIGYFVNMIPDVELNVIHRQSVESHIRTIADHIMNIPDNATRISIPSFRTEDVISASIDYDAQLREMFLDNIDLFDIVITYKNDNVAILNNIIRNNIYKKSGKNLSSIARLAPQEGDKLYLNARFNNLDKGSLLKITSVKELDYISGVGVIDVIDEDNLITENLPIRLNFIGFNVKPKICSASVDWGFAITAHKSQGSQWEKVCVIDSLFYESLRPNPSEIDRLRFASRRSFLYTSITRSSEVLWLLSWFGISKYNSNEEK
jgi:exodeoxyribonuclease-5